MNVDGLALTLKDLCEEILRPTTVRALNDSDFDDVRYLCVLYLTTMPLYRLQGSNLDGRWMFNRKQLERIARMTGYKFEYTRVALRVFERLRQAQPPLLAAIANEKTNYHTC